jgi:ribosomal protein S9
MEIMLFNMFWNMAKEKKNLQSFRRRKASWCNCLNINLQGKIFFNQNLFNLIFPHYGNILYLMKNLFPIATTNLVIIEFVHHMHLLIEFAHFFF